MKTGGAVQINVQLDINEMKKGIAVANEWLNGLSKTTMTVAKSISEAFHPDLGGMSRIETSLNGIANSLDTVVGKMEELTSLLAPKEAGFLDGILSGVDGFNSVADGIGNINNISKELHKGIETAEKSDETFNIFKALVPDAVKVANDIGSSVGTAFSSFGTTIAQIATSTGAWIANTAAKVANTAAQWAQIAATTAWQGICAAATAVTTAFGAAMTFLTSPIGLVVIGIVALIAIIVLLIANWDKVSAAVINFMDILKNALEKLDAFVQSIFDVDWTERFGVFGNVLNAFFANVENIWNAIKNIFSNIISFVKNVFAGDWGAAWDSIVNVFKGIWDYLVAIVKAPINGIIRLINGLVQGVVYGINLVIGALNGISFDIPDWVPLIGGQTFGFNLALLNAPKIPLLAKGAVLPANRPFLAMVGDQRHGTNIEAPLATIQEAVALVMEDQFAGMMAGFEASVGVQKQILQAVLGIEIGDTTIGQAAARYNTKMAIIRGGM